MALLNSRSPDNLLLPFILAAPTLLAFSLPPAPTLLNQVLAMVGWGGLLLLHSQVPQPALRGAPAMAPLWAVLLLCCGVVISWGHSLPSGLAFQYLACLGSAAGLIWVASQAPANQKPHQGQTPASAEDDSQLFANAMLLTALVSAILGCIQVFKPEWADGTFIIPTNRPGRAVGNLRQPNHLALLLLWGLVAAVPVGQCGRWLGLRLSRWAITGLGALLVLGLVLSASRTGLLGLMLFAAWGGFDRKMPKWLRVHLISTPLLYLLIWLAVRWWAHAYGQPFGGEARLAEQDPSGYRFTIWQHTWALISANPWFGVGFGEFNFAWTLTPFADRPHLLFDHAHNLPLQLAAELGLPMAVAIFALLLWGVIQAARRSWQVTGESALAARASFMTVLMIGIHSLLEFPLWYADCLLPTAWAWGLALRLPVAEQADPAVQPSQASRWQIGFLGILMAAGGAWAEFDYQKIAVIFLPGNSSKLEETITMGRESVFFPYLASYARATSPSPESADPSQALTPFRDSTHALLTSDLLIAWSHTLAQAGQRDQARYLAARLREFRLPDTDEFFEVCSKASPPEPTPFQCETPVQAYEWRDFLQ